MILQQNYRPLSPFISLYLLLSTRQAELVKIEFNPLIFKNNDEKNKKGLEAWQEEIKEIDLQIREHQTVINQLRERKQKLIAAHRKKRKPAWDSETPLYRLVNLQQYGYYQLMIAEWQKRTTDNFDPRKTAFFTFPPHLKHYVFRALATALALTPAVFHVSTLQLCHYLAEHSDLGDALAIHRAVYRAMKGI